MKPSKSLVAVFAACMLMLSPATSRALASPALAPVSALRLVPALLSPVPALLTPQGGKPASGKEAGKKKDDAKKAPAKDDPEVLRLLKELKKVIKGRADGDSEGARILDALADKYEALNAKQKKLVAKGVGACFKARRKPDQVVLLLSAGEVLSRFGENGAAILAKAAEDRRFKKKPWSTFRSQIVRNLGRPADKRYIRLLLDLALKDNDDQVRAKAGEALGYYAKFDQKQRKNIVGKLVKSLEEVYGQSKSNIDPNDLNREVWAQRYAAIQDPWMRTLKRMTGQSIKDVQAWTKWWNEHKRENWDKHGYRGASPRGS